MNKLDISKLKVGDELGKLFEANYAYPEHYSFYRVEKITPKGNVRLNDGQLLKVGYNYFDIEYKTDDMVEFNRRSFFTNSLRWELRNGKYKLDYNKAKRIKEILDEK